MAITPTIPAIYPCSEFEAGFQPSHNACDDVSESWQEDIEALCGARRAGGCKGRVIQTAHKSLSERVSDGSGRKRFSNSTDRSPAKSSESLPFRHGWHVGNVFEERFPPSPRVSFLPSSPPSLIADRSTQTNAISGTPTHMRPWQVTTINSATASPQFPVTSASRLPHSHESSCQIARIRNIQNQPYSRT